MFSRRNSIWIAAAIVLPVAAAVGVLVNQRQAATQQRHRAEALSGGVAARGAVLFAAKGCGGCHTLHGVSSGMVGPPLDGVAERAVIAGLLENSPDSMSRWIRDPQGIVLGSAMPNLAMTPQDARDIAAFLYSAT